MSGKPLLFLDVDGVFNRFALQSAPTVVGEPWTRATVEYPGYAYLPLVLDRADAARVRTMAEVAEAVWATTWNDRANTILAPLIGLDPLPVAPMHRKFSERDETAQWKWRHVMEYADGRPFVWIDDGFTRQMLTDAIRRSRWSGIGCELVQAQPVGGLTDAMVEDVCGFAALAAR